MVAVEMFPDEEVPQATNGEPPPPPPPAGPPKPPPTDPILPHEIC